MFIRLLRHSTKHDCGGKIPYFIREVSGSNLSGGKSYPDRSFSVFLSSSKQMPWQCFDLSTACSFQITSSSSIIIPQATRNVDIILKQATQRGRWQQNCLTNTRSSSSSKVTTVHARAYRKWDAIAQKTFVTYRSDETAKCDGHNFGNSFNVSFLDRLRLLLNTLYLHAHAIIIMSSSLLQTRRSWLTLTNTLLAQAGN